MIKDIVVVKDTGFNELTKKNKSIIYPEIDLSTPSQSVDLIPESLPVILELYKEYREDKKQEMEHKRAMKEIEIQDKRWTYAIHIRSKERDKLHDKLQADVEKTEDISRKLALYNQWVESIRQPLVLSEEVNPFKGGDK